MAVRKSGPVDEAGAGPCWSQCRRLNDRTGGRRRETETTMTVRAFSIAAAFAASMLAVPAFAADTVTPFNPATPAAPTAALAVPASTASTPTVAALSEPSKIATPVQTPGGQVPTKDAVKIEKQVDAFGAKAPVKKRHHATKSSLQPAHEDAGVLKTIAPAPSGAPKAGTQVAQ